MVTKYKFEFLEKGYIALLQLLVVVTPILFVKSLGEIFEFPKMTFVYIIGSLLALLFFINILIKEERNSRVNKLVSAVLIFLAAYLISTITSMSQYTSIWGYYSRFNGGLASIIIYTLIFIVFSTLNKKEKNKILYLALISTIPVSFYAILQHFGFEKGMWGEDSQARVFATLGQPNWLAAYILILYFYGFERLLKTKEYLEKVLIAITLLFGFSAFWFTYSLSGILGFIGGMGIFLLTIFIKEKGILRNNFKLLAIVLGLSAIIAITNLGILKPKIADSILDIRNTLTKEFVAFAEENPQRFGDTTAIRIVLWKDTLKLITSSPKIFLIGSGPETYPYAFPEFRSMDLNNSSEWNFVFNKPHNYYLELLANLGILGFITYIGIVVIAIKYAKDKKAYGILASLAAFLISNIFGWPTVTTSLIFYLYLGYLNDYE